MLLPQQVTTLRVNQHQLQLCRLTRPPGLELGLWLPMTCLLPAHRQASVAASQIGQHVLLCAMFLCALQAVSHCRASSVSMLDCPAEMHSNSSDMTTPSPAHEKQQVHAHPLPPSCSEHEAQHEPSASFVTALLQYAAVVERSKFWLDMLIDFHLDKQGTIKFCYNSPCCVMYSALVRQPSLFITLLQA